MSENITVIKEQPPITDAVAFSNGIRLTLRQWLGIGLFALAFVIAAPTLWNQLEDFPTEPDYRIPHELGNDYWLYERCAQQAAQRYDGAVIGDSVVWGEYVTRPETLSHYLNKQAGGERFANLGLGGAHQLALIGLMDHYAGSIRNMNVVLQCNPLWMSSPRADLSDDSDEAINHPRLIPQFVPRIPRYKEEISRRLGVLIEQRVPFSKWTNHLPQAYYDQTDIPGWTLTHPYDNPIAPLTRSLPPSGNELRYLQEPWYKTKKQVTYEWFDPRETPLQWTAFEQVVGILQQRGNRVFVVVGPLNEHMLTAPSRERYQKVKDMIGRRLEALKIPHIISAVLPSEQYGDVSHPLPEGYATLAGQVWDDPAFRAMMAP